MTQTKVASTKNVKLVPVERTFMKKGLQPGDKLPQRRSRLRKYPSLSEEQQKLVQDHLWIAGRLAHSAKSLTGGSTGCFTRDDLESVAFLALCVSASRFDPSLGWKFSTYAWNTARGWIQHALRDHSRMVRVPRWIAGIRQDVRDMIFNGFTYSEISDELGLSEKQITMCEESWQDVHSSYDQTPDDHRPREFIYEIDEVKTLLGVETLKKIGDLSDQDIGTLLQHVEDELESDEERAKAEALLIQIRKNLSE